MLGVGFEFFILNPPILNIERRNIQPFRRRKVLCYSVVCVWLCNQLKKASFGITMRLPNFMRGNPLTLQGYMQ